MKRDRMIPLLLVLLMLIGAVATITQTPAQAITPAQTDPLPEKAYLPLVVRSRPTVKIATHFPLSGSLGREGISMRNAAELGLEQQAAALRERGFEVVLAVYDDAGSPELAQRNAAEIIADPTILCVNGHLTSDAALAALPLYARVDLPMVSPANTAPEVTDVFTNSFRLVGRDDIQGIVGLRFARSVLRASSATSCMILLPMGKALPKCSGAKPSSNRLGLQALLGQMKRQTLTASSMTSGRPIPALSTMPDVRQLRERFSGKPVTRSAEPLARCHSLDPMAWIRRS